jgi:hypothetical protein
MAANVKQKSGFHSFLSTIYDKKTPETGSKEGE